MAVQVAILDELHKHDTPPQSTYRSDEIHGLRSRIRTLVGFWEGLTAERESRRRVQASKKEVAFKELWKPNRDAAQEVGALPTYEDCLLDLPPDYSTTGLLAQAQCMQSADVATNSIQTRTQATTTSQLFAASPDIELDFHKDQGFRQVAGKKAKKAAKLAAQSKWAGSDNEDNKDEPSAPGGSGQDEGAGAGAGGGAGGAGDGGDNPGENDGSDDGKKGKGKKQKKKSPWEELEEEEAKQKAEEEVAAADAGAGASNEADPIDDFGSFAISKKDKKKKAKAAAAAFARDEPEPAEDVPEAAIEPPPPAEAAIEDEWGAFATVGKKKKKGKTALLDPEPEPAKVEESEPTPPKEMEDPWASFATVGKAKKSKKKLAADPEPIPETEPVTEPPKATLKSSKKNKGKSDGANEPNKDDKSDMKCDDINLNDDKAAPKLDLDFGLDKKDDSNEEKSSSFSFGGWGGGWGGSGNSWGFGSIAGKAEAETAIEPEPKVDAGWGFSSKRKDDQKPSSNTFNFGLDDAAGDADLDALAAPEEPNPAEEDPWGGFVSAKEKRKQDKAAKRKGVAVVPEPEIVEAAPEEPVKVEEDPWGNFTTKSKKSKKKSTLSAWDAADPEPIIVTPEPEIEPPKEEDDIWSAKDKKKSDKAKKKQAAEPVVVVPELDPDPVPVAEAAKEADGFGWGVSAKKSKSKKKATFDWSEEPAAEPEIVEVPSAEPEPPANDWLSGGWADTSTTKKKKSKKVAVEEPPPPPVILDAPVADAGGELPIAELEPEAVVEPATADDGCANTWSTGTKKKSSKKSDRSKGIVEIADPSPGASVLLPESVQEKSAEDDPWAEASWTTGKKLKSKTKKGAAEPPPPPPPAALPAPRETEELDPNDGNAGTDLLDLNEPATEDPWSFTTTTSKKKSKRVKEEPAIVELPLSKTKSKDSKSSAEAPTDDILDIVEEVAPEAEPVKDNKVTSKDDKASAGWGSSLWGNKKETSKEKKAREKREKQEREAAEAAEEAEANRIAEEAEAQRIAEEEAFAAAIGEDPTDLLDDLDEPPPAPVVEDKKRSSKSKASKLSKVESKPSKKSEPKEELVAAVVEDPIISFDEPKQADGWGFWGASLKSTKKATPAAEMSKDPWANQDQVVHDSSKMPDGSSDDVAAMSPLKSVEKVSSKSKGVKGSSVRDRISALGAEAVSDAKTAKSKKDKTSAPADPEPEVVPEPIPMIEVTPEPEQHSKAKKSDRKSKKLKEPELASSPPPPPPISPVPGGFPVDDLLDDLEPEMPVSPPKKSSKDKKLVSKTGKASKTKTEAVVEQPTPPAALDDAPKLPTPPPEDAPRDDKSFKKERPKVVRDNKSASWGFWGATPAKKPRKQEAESKDDVTSPKATERPSGVSRSKSARKTSERDMLDKDSKSSSSNKGQKESRSRPSTSRGMSFGGLFSTPQQPSRSKSTRISTSAGKSSSRRHSTAVDDSGLVSPPPDMSAKAAKLVGVTPFMSTREKKTRMIPDPYPIDSDDMIMVDVPDDSAKDMDDPREKKSSSRSKRHQMSGELGAMGDDAVEAPRRFEETKIFSEPNDIAFVERPAPPRRSSTMKKAGLMGGILGAFGGSARPSAERRHSKYDTEDASTSRRKRDVAYDDDGSKRLRREDRKVHRSARKASDGDGLTDAAPITDVEADEAREARRRERRERRAREEAEETDRNARREERRRAKAKEEEDRQLREAKERRARRHARRAEEERLAREEEEVRAERHERRRQRAAEEPPVKVSRPTTDRRRSSHMDTAPTDDDEARRIRREGRRLKRNVDATATVSGRDRERPRTTRRQSEYPEDRNGEPISSHGAIPASFTHAIKTGGDKTSSWVHSVEDAPPPPIEATIVDAPVHFAADPDPDPLDEGETTAREFRHRRERRRERDDGYGLGDDSRRHDGIKSSSGDGSSGRRRRSYVSPPTYGDMYGGGMRTFDGRPPIPQRSDSKRGSWFKKIAGL